MTLEEWNTPHLIQEEQNSWLKDGHLVIPQMSSSDTKSFKCCTTHLPQDTLAEMRPSAKSPMHTGSPGCRHGSQTTLQDVRCTSRTRMSPIANARCCTTSPHQKMHFHSNR